MRKNVERLSTCVSGLLTTNIRMLLNGGGARKTIFFGYFTRDTILQEPLPNISAALPP